MMASLRYCPDGHMCLRRPLGQFPFGDGTFHCCFVRAMLLRLLYIMCSQYHLLHLVAKSRCMSVSGEAPGVTIVNSSAKSSMEHATAYGIPAKTSPLGRTFEPPPVLYSCANDVSKVHSRSFPMTVSISSST